MDKLKVILVGLLFLSLLFVDYFLLVYGFKEVLSFDLEDSLSILSSLMSFLSILSAASVAIYVMNKNHENEKIRKTEDIEEQSALRLNKLTIYVCQILTISGSVNKSLVYSKVIYVRDEDKGIFIKFIDEIQYYCNKILDEDVVLGSENYQDIINCCTDTLNQLRILRTNFIDTPKEFHDINDVVVPIKKIISSSLKVLENTKYYKMSDDYKIL